MSAAVAGALVLALIVAGAALPGMVGIWREGDRVRGDR